MMKRKQVKREPEPHDAMSGFSLSQLPQHAREQFLRRGLHAAAQHVEHDRTRMEPLGRFDECARVSVS